MKGIVYEIAKNELTQIASTGENFNFSMLTVDTHQPYGYRCELCDNQYEEQYANAIACASRQAYEFVRVVLLLKPLQRLLDCQKVHCKN